MSECQGHWCHVEDKEDGEGGYVQRFVCSDCTDEMLIAQPQGRLIATVTDGVREPVR